VASLTSTSAGSKLATISPSIVDMIRCIKVQDRRNLYLVPSTGTVVINGVRVEQGDGVAITRERTLELRALEDTELVVVELV